MESQEPQNGQPKEVTMNPTAGKINYFLVVVLIVMSFVIGVLWTQNQKATKRLANVPTTNTTNPTPSGNSEVTQNLSGTVEPLSADDYVKGNRDARILLIEYSDFECPFCKSFHPIAQQVVDYYQDDVAWVYRHFPLNIHPNAQREAEGAVCAGKIAGNDGFWAYTDTLFEIQPSNNQFDIDELPDVVSQAGLNVALWQECMDSGEATATVEAQALAGANAGITGTPGNVILDTQTGETTLIPGALPFAQLSQVIDSFLAN